MGGIAVNQAGRVYLTGYMHGDVDFDPSAQNFFLTTINYSMYLWAFDENGNYDYAVGTGWNSTGSNTPHDIAVSSSGPIYTTGNYSNEIDFDPTSGDFTLTANATDGFVQKLVFCSPSSATDTQTACSSYTWIDGVTYTSNNNTAVDTLQSVGGCDSVVMLDLTIISPTTETVSAGTNSFLCSGSTTIDLGSSMNGLNYYLRDDSNDSIIAGPLAGTGSSIGFNTGIVNSTTSYNVIAGVPATTAIEFASGDEKVVIPNDPAFEFSTGVVEMWIRPDDNSGANINRALIGMRDGLGNDTRWSFHINTSNSTIGVYNGNSFAALTATGLIAGQWYHVAFALTPSNTEIFLDGVSLGSVGFGPNAAVTGKDLTIGNHNDPVLSTEDFIGLVDDVRIWNVARTGAQIVAAKDSCLTGNESGLVALYNFESSGQTIIADITGSGHNGTLSNMDANSDYVTSYVECLSCATEMQNTVTVSIEGIQDLTSTGSDSTHLCDNGTATIDLSDSQTDVNYYLIDLSNGNAVVSAMTPGTGNAISITTSTLSSPGTLLLVAYSTADSANCSTPLSVLHTITVGSVDVSVSVNQFTVTANTTGAQYQWVDCNDNYSAIVGETGQTFTATSNGDYAVIVTENNCSDTSACQNITGIGVGEHNLNDAVSVYPNPSNGQFTVNVAQLPQGTTIRVLDMVGKELYYTNVVSDNTFIELNAQASGIYLVLVNTPKGNAVKQLILR